MVVTCLLLAIDRRWLGEQRADKPAAAACRYIVGFFGFDGRRLDYVSRPRQTIFRLASVLAIFHPPWVSLFNAIRPAGAIVSCRPCWPRRVLNDI